MCALSFPHPPHYNLALRNPTCPALFLLASSMQPDYEQERKGVGVADYSAQVLVRGVARFTMT